MDALYLFFSAAILAVLLILPGWFLARLNRMRQRQHAVQSGAANPDPMIPKVVTARAGVAMSALNTMTEK